MVSFDYYYCYQNPSGFALCANWGFCYLNLAGITKFMSEKTK